MATKIPTAQNRMFKNVFVCKNCGQKIRTDSVRVIAQKVKCRRCDKKVFRPKKTKKK
ncbi:hypothetical protein GW923_01335 [Candidatus Pacearchaeota archaeon]|nr:hypothetical protein [Candidatus Pacearchaeota archaeon]